VYAAQQRNTLSLCIIIAPVVLQVPDNTSKSDTMFPSSRKLHRDGKACLDWASGATPAFAQVHDTDSQNNLLPSACSVRHSAVLQHRQLDRRTSFHIHIRANVSQVTEDTPQVHWADTRSAWKPSSFAHDAHHPHLQAPNVLERSTGDGQQSARLECNSAILASAVLNFRKFPRLTAALPSRC